jgi:hypothetical protein
VNPAVPAGVCAGSVYCELLLVLLWELPCGMAATAVGCAFDL